MFEGVGVALVTPFDAQLSVDFPALEKLVNHTLAGGIDYLVVQGTTGESATTTSEEKKQILDFVLKVNNGRKPVVYGIGGNNTTDIVEKLKSFDVKGISGILSVSPYYNKPSQDGIFRHYQAIAEATPLPIILYNVPGRTASNMTADTTLRLAEIPNIVGVKEASGNLEQCMAIAKNKPKDFLLISGDDMLTTPMISIGARGVISVLANAFPKVFSDMVHSALHGNYEQSQNHLFRLLDINHLMYTESNPVGIKQTLAELGVCENFVRLPLVEASEQLRSAIRQKIGDLR